MTSPFSCSAASSGLPRLFHMSKPSLKWGPSSPGQELLCVLRRKFANLDLLSIRHFEKFDFRSDTHGTGLILGKYQTGNCAIWLVDFLYQPSQELSRVINENTDPQLANQNAPFCGRTRAPYNKPCYQHWANTILSWISQYTRIWLRVRLVLRNSKIPPYRARSTYYNLACLFSGSSRKSPWIFWMSARRPTRLCRTSCSRTTWSTGPIRPVCRWPWPLSMRSSWRMHAARLCWGISGRGRSRWNTAGP